MTQGGGVAVAGGLAPVVAGRPEGELVMAMKAQMNSVAGSR